MAGMTGKTIAETYHGILKTAGDNVNFSTGATARNIVDGEETTSALWLSSNRVGIGIATPACDLHIGGTNPQIRIGDDGAEDTSLCFMGNAEDFYIALDDTTDDLTIGTGTTIGSNAKMVIENGGNVGIGTVSPAAPGSFGSAAPYVEIYGAQPTFGINESDGTWWVFNASGNILSIYDETANLTAMAFDASGSDVKVGIGTASPISAFEIESGTGTGGAVLTLGTKETAVDAADVLGRINFYAPLEDGGTDAIAVAASIAAVAQASFTASVNSTALYFQTGTSEVATTKMVIDEDGFVGIGTDSPFQSAFASGFKYLTISSSTVNKAGALELYGNGNDGDDTTLGTIVFGDNANTTGSASVISCIQAETVGTHATNSGGKLHFQTKADNGTLGISMTILGSGNVGIGTAAPGNPLAVNRSGDGVIVDFESADAVEGTVSISGSTCSYNAFFGAHYTELSDGTDQSSLLVGTVLDSTDALVENKFTNGKRLPKCKVNTVADSSGVYGVYHCDVNSDGVEAVEAVVAVEAVLDDDGNIIEEAVEAVEAVVAIPATVVGLNAGGLGAYFIRIHKDIDISIGDLLVSNGDGTAKKQDDDIIRSKTIGKVTSTAKKETYPDGSYIVPCVLYCG